MNFWQFHPFSPFYPLFGFWANGQHKIDTDEGIVATPFIAEKTKSGETVTVSRSMKLSVVWACVNLRSRIISSMPLNIKNQDRTIAVDNPLYDLLHRSPNNDMTASDFWGLISLDLDLWGNAYVLIKKNSTGNITTLNPLPPAKVLPRRNQNGSVSYLSYKDKEKKEEYQEYSEDEILHFRGISFNGLIGLSPIEYAANFLGSQIAADKTADTLFANSLKSPVIIETGERILQNAQREQLRENLAYFTQPENAGRALVLEAGQKIATNKISLSPMDSQLLDSRKWGVEEICRIFGVPPVLIGHTDKSSSWSSSLEQTNQQFLTYGIDPTLVRFEQTLEKKLLTATQRKDGMLIQFNRSALLRADMASRANFYTSLLQNGVMTRNEARSYEDFPKSTEKQADELTVQLNMTTLSQLGQPEK